MINFSSIFVLPTLTLFIVFFTSAAAAGTTRRGGRILHQPFFPVESDIQPAASPSPSPKPHQKQQPKQPVSETPSTPQSTFFPTTVPSPPPPPVPPPPKVVATFPANISDLLFPHPPSTSSSRSHVIVIAVSVSFLSVALIIILATCAYFYRRRSFVAVEKASRADSVRLYPPNTATSDGGVVKPGSSSSTSTSSDFLYLGILPNPPPGSNDETATRSSNASTKISIPGLSSSSPTAYQRLDSPELNPLPPLPRQNLKQNNWNSEAALDTDEDDDNDEEEEFFSPRGSSPASKDSPDLRHDPLGVARNLSSSRRDYSGLFGADRYGSRSFNSRTASYLFSNSCSSRNTPSNTLSPSPPCNTSPKSLKSGSPEVMMKFPAPSRPPPLPPLQNTPTILSNSSSSSSSTFNVANGNGGIENQLLPRKLPPSPPLVPPPRFWDNHEHDSSATSPILSGPSSSDPAEAQSSTADQVQSNGVIQERSEETTPRPKLKPLHWDKVRASSDRAMVWDQLKSSSFQLNEEMIETLFMVNGSNIGHKDNVRRPIMPLLNPENRVLDPKKSQNIAILLRALNVTVEEVCEALSQGNADSLGSELLESLLKMAPTKEEERKLRDFKDESPFKLGPAEKFLKAVLDIPFAFKRVDAMLYIANFDSEIEYLERSFGTLEAACKELRSSRMFLKLLEAVLKTGNRMNVGTNRGDAHAFKLDTLLKLVDVKGKDGKTTLLHFVVQEIVRSEGSQVSGNDPIPKQNNETSLRDDLEFRKLGLQVVSSLSRELTSVKKAATMDSCVLSNEVGKLTEGIIKVKDVVKLSNETEMDRKFPETMKVFLKKAEEEIVKIEEQKRCAFGVVKEVTEYFHGDSGKEEAHPLRIFTVVRDFLAVLDQVCREVGKVHERTIYGSGSTRQFSMPANPILVPVVTMLDVKRRYSSSSEDEGSSLA